MVTLHMFYRGWEVPLRVQKALTPIKANNGITVYETFSACHGVPAPIAKLVRDDGSVTQEFGCEAVLALLDEIIN